MKKRKGITRKIRDGWIERWELDNSQSALYFSFIKTQDIKSYGSKARVPDFCDDSQDRNLLSTNERLFFYRLRFSKRFVWIKEQYPLLPLARAMAVAKELKLKYPTYPYTSNIEVVMTSDFYCQDFTGQQYVYSIKDEKQFAKATERQKRNIEAKLKIEKLFWESQGVKWFLILSNSIKNTFSQNLGQIIASHKLSPLLKVLRQRWLNVFKEVLNNGYGERLSYLMEVTAQQLNITYEDAVELFQHCVWHREIKASLSTIRLRFEYSAESLGLEVPP
ncbi:heteromeric transposase endonuclease subunit TnsA [Pseudoalteromonas sp. NBT06-2]|uniref:TnsA endonuclease N-terminal domain-containing protein n=1 Tax=Pseudoalteromonas sp. NBT06-2 TaxID=2025950 RepID=UPI000BA6C6BB|nr:TnsA endonuclease N-terminal domain-containing protein [Pseudoalteromonas sp. NBT06-2]PAJ74105.1 heteromeric transposase endonuclease subunit TnsA [Pseudoalteromonas sp. NBT06-2]